MTRVIIPPSDNSDGLNLAGLAAPQLELQTLPPRPLVLGGCGGTINHTDAAALEYRHAGV